MASQTFTTTGSQNWNWPAGVTSVVVEAVGGGGGGGIASGNPATGGGGRGGNYAKATLTKGAESLLVIVVGTGGAIASAGAASTVTQNAVLRVAALGGGGGATQASSSANGAGATVAGAGTPTGATLFTGGNGGTGNFTSGTQGSGAGGGAAGPTANGTAASVNAAGSGNTGAWADGVTVRSGNGAAGVGNSLPGIAGPTYGGGASGGKATTGADQNGGIGGQGIVVLTWVAPDQAVAGTTIAAGSLTRTPTVAFPPPAGSLVIPIQDFNFPDGTHPPNPPWSVPRGDFYSLNQTMVGTGGAATWNIAYWNANVFAADHYVECDVLYSRDNYGGPAIGVQPDSACYVLMCNSDSNTMGFTRFPSTSGGEVDLFPRPPVAPGDRLRAERVGNNLLAYRNGTLVITVTDTVLMGGASGFASYQTARFDNWTGGNLGTASPPDQGIAGAHLASTAILQRPTVTLRDQTILLPAITEADGDLVLEDGFSLLHEDGTALLLEARSGLAQVFAPAVTGVAPVQAIGGVTLASASLVRLPSVSPGPVGVTGITRGSTLALFTPALTAVSAGDLAAGTVATTAVVNAPSVVGGLVTIMLPPALAATSQVRAPSVALGPATILGATRPSTAQVFTPALAVGPVGVLAATRTSTVQTFPATVTAGPVTVLAATLASTRVLFAPGVAAHVLAATLASTLGVFAPGTVVGPVTVAGGIVASTVGLFPPSSAREVLLPIELQPQTLPQPTVGVPYRQQLTATGGLHGPYLFTLVAGTLPTGLTLSAAGLIAGTPTDAPVVSPTSLPDGVVDERYWVPILVTTARHDDWFTVQATDTASLMVGTQEYFLTTWGGPLHFESIESMGPMPTCLRCTPRGNITGRPMRVGVFPIYLRALDAAGHEVLITYTLTVRPGSP